MSGEFFNPGTFQNMSTQGQNMRVRQDLTRLRLQATTAQTQLASGFKSETHGGLKAMATVAQELRHRVQRVDGYRQTVQAVELRLQSVQQAMSTIREGVNAVRQGATDAVAPGFPQSIAASRVTARSTVSSIVALVNTSQGGRHLFSGAEVATQPTVTPGALLDGQGGRAGLKTVIEQRLAADLGTGTGRLATAVGGSVVTLTHDGGAFGMRPTSVAGPGTGGPTATNATTTTATLDAAAVANGQQVSVTFEMPDGTELSIGLIASPAPLPASPGTDTYYFETGSVASLQTVLNTAITTVVNRDMTGASAMAAGNNFFDHNVALVPDDPAANATRLVMNSSSVIDWFAVPAQPVQVKSIANDPGALAPAPQRGDTHVVGTAGVGLWAGQNGNLATFNGVGWTFVQPEVGARVIPEPATAADQPHVFTFGTTGWTDSGAAPPQIPARDTVQGKVDDAVFIAHGARADEPGVRDSLKVAAVMAAAGYDLNAPAAYQQVARKAMAAGSQAHSGALSLQSELGVIEERTRRLGESHQDFRSLLNRQIVEVEGADQFEVASRLQELMTRLEASFAVVSRLQSMSLVNHL